jgi:hypothetical protein
MSRRTWTAIAVVAALLPATLALADSHDGPPPLPDRAGPLYLIVSVPDEFSIDFGGDGEFGDAQGSDCIVVNLGYVVGGEAALDAAAVIGAIAPFALGDVTFDSLEGNQVTVIGSYAVPHPVEGDEPHVVNTSTDDVPFDVQFALYDSTRNGAIDALGPFTNTLDVVNAVSGDFSVDGQDVYDAVFTTDQVFSLGNGILSTEGELFPHVPSTAAPLFRFETSLEQDDDGDVVVTTDVCRIVGVDVKPNASPNLLKISTKKGAMKVAFLTDGFFDAADVDPTTARIGSVGPTWDKMQDVDGDGDDDLVLKFKVKDLVEAGVVDDCTTEVTLRADLVDGTCVTGTDAVQPSDDCAVEN